MRMSRKTQTIMGRLRGLLNQHRSPPEVALGVAIGIFIAITPLYGFHTLMVLGAAFLFKRANVVAMFIGTSISNTLTFPLITWAGYTIGRFFLGPAYPPLDREVFRRFDFHKLLHMYVPLLSGSLVLGAVLGLVAYFAVLVIMKGWKKGMSGGMAAPCAMCAALVCLQAFPAAGAQPSAVLTYAISPLGKAQYRDEGLVDGERGKESLAVFTTAAPGFRDTEKIYSDPVTRLPLRVERSVSFLFRKERLVETYDQASHSLVIRKFIGAREAAVYRFSSDGPLQNAVTLPFSLSCADKLGKGWSMEVRIPQRFTVTLAAKEEIKVPAGRFTAYRFDSSPRKFQIWISAGPDAVPLKIKGLGTYSLQLSRR
jgi:uncharacterized protein (DUF2062 family)